jgi:hypothetical protein
MFKKDITANPSDLYEHSFVLTVDARESYANAIKCFLPYGYPGNEKH